MTNKTKGSSSLREPDLFDVFLAVDEPISHCAVTTRDSVILSVVRGLTQIASMSKENMKKMSKDVDVISTCLESFVDYLRCDDQRSEGG